jgi:hypothetical protein
VSDELTLIAEAEGKPKVPSYSGTCFGWGFALLAIGAVAIYFGLSADTSAPDAEVLNIGLLQNQLILVSGGLTLSGCGIIGMFIACLIETLERRLK